MASGEQNPEHLDDLRGACSTGDLEQVQRLLAVALVGKKAASNLLEYASSMRLTMWRSCVAYFATEPISDSALPNMDTDHDDLRDFFHHSPNTGTP
ncbi:hypothetical protein CERZMDRAFT_101528 [Cercospora zeae-maydis SCOH1-5]|uniref:Uncharacterized protein n=1 Tax=Cercospora zeae-maydis SCOH1-5 TaxID=717836 RepID=A0A6A6F763_9PEZI|nr:hypothetical protein CERZMDRAFT_101528 [Cercospora zeae-maydis SCOH1-5]